MSRHHLLRLAVCVVFAVVLRSETVQAQTFSPWKGLFYNSDFSILKDPEHDYLFGEELKDIPLDFAGCKSRFSTGGELRYRYMDEDQRIRPGGPGRSTYNLWRWRHYVDFQYDDRFRAYVEMLDASIFNEELPITPIDLNRWNIQNAFVDIKLPELLDRDVSLRVGRQELLYGKQYLVSPLDWGNTRRNFEGLKLFSKGQTWDFDAFLTRPVNTAAGNLPLERFDNERDRADQSRTFSGVYATHHGLKNHTFDAYWLWSREQEPDPTLPDGSRHTVGARWQGSYPVAGCDCEPVRVWNAFVEGAYQFGHDNGETVQAGFFVAELVHAWKQVRWNPTLGGGFYWGSGDHDPNDDENNTFNVMFPLGHAYWGIIDNLAGQNLNDLYLKASAKPTSKLTLVSAMHWFDLDQDTDALYNVAGVPFGAPNTGTEIGEELDLIATYAFTPNFNVQTGYSWFWYGTFVQNNLPHDTAQQFYVQSTLRY